MKKTEESKPVVDTWQQPKPIDDAQAAFPANVIGNGLLPPMEIIPKEFHVGRGNGHTVWNSLFSEIFYGVKKDRPTQYRVRDGIDQSTAVRHVQAVMGSFEPQHQHKEAGVAWLLSRWFEIIPDKERP